ncbi:MAG: hypothetical protein ABJA57_09660 [Ginsengibacter sp.]
MKKVIFAFLCLPCIVQAQTNNLFSVDRVFPKPDKVQLFEKALVAHEQKYHKGNWAWEVYTVETGPEAGGYRIVEGPMSWDVYDHRGTLGEAHTNDYTKTITPYLTETDKASTSFILFREDLSTAKITDRADKIAMNHVYPKPGYGEDMEDAIKKLKKVWEASGQVVGVYEVQASGEFQYLFITLYKQGLKERERTFRTPMKERYTTANGEGSWMAYQQSLRNMIDHSWSEMLFYHPELGSKK